MLLICGDHLWIPALPPSRQGLRHEKEPFVVVLEELYLTVPLKVSDKYCEARSRKATLPFQGKQRAGFIQHAPIPERGDMNVAKVWADLVTGSNLQRQKKKRDTLPHALHLSFFTYPHTTMVHGVLSVVDKTSY